MSAHYIFDILIEKADFRPDLLNGRAVVSIRADVGGFGQTISTAMVQMGQTTFFHYQARAFLPSIGNGYVNFSVVTDYAGRTVQTLCHAKLPMSYFPEGNPKRYKVPMIATYDDQTKLAEVTIHGTLTDLTLHRNRTVASPQPVLPIIAQTRNSSVVGTQYPVPQIPQMKPPAFIPPNRNNIQPSTGPQLPLLPMYPQV